MRDFLKKEFLLGLGTGFIISAIIISFYGTDLPAASQTGNANKVAETGGSQEADKKTDAFKETAENAEKNPAPQKENGTDVPADSTKGTAVSAPGTAAKPKTETTPDTTKSVDVPDANVSKDAQQKPPSDAPVKTEKYADVVVKAGMTSERISSILEEQGIVQDKDAFYQLVTAHKAHAKFKIGTFKVPVGGDMEAILDILTGQKN